MEGSWKWSKRLSRMDMMEVFIEVKENHVEFLLAIVHLPSSSTKAIIVNIVPFFEALLHVGYLEEKHEALPSPACEVLSMEDPSTQWNKPLSPTEEEVDNGFHRETKPSPSVVFLPTVSDTLPTAALHVQSPQICLPIHANFI